MKTLTSGARRILCAALVLLLCAALLPTAALAAKAEASATTMRLESATGTVTVRNASSQSKSLFNNMQLYSGWSVETAASASATLSLDGSKAVKLDAGTKVELKQNTATKKLELFLSKGKLFFDVSEKLASDESMNIRTSTMVCGIRGTIGEAGVLMPEEESAAPTSYLLLGEGASDVMYYAQGTGVESAAIPVNVALPASTLSQLQVLRVEAGQRLTLTEDAAGRVEPQITRFTDDPLDLNGFSGFSLGDLTAEPELIARIRAATGGTLDYDDLTADQVQERQKKECTRLELLQQKLRTQQETLIQRLKAELRLQKTNTIDTWTGGNSGTGGGGIAPAPDPNATYSITVAAGIVGGTVTVSPSAAAAGETVTVTATPEEGNRLAALQYSYTDGTGSHVANVPYDTENEKYAFQAPEANTTVTAVFEDENATHTISFTETLQNAFANNNFDVRLSRQGATSYIDLNNDYSFSGAVAGVTYELELITGLEGTGIDPASVTVTGSSAVPTEIDLHSGEMLVGSYSFIMPPEDVVVSGETAPCYSVQGYTNDYGSVLIASVCGMALDENDYLTFAVYDAVGHDDIVLIQVTAEDGWHLKENSLTVDHFENNDTVHVPATAVDASKGIWSYEMLPYHSWMTAEFERDSYTISGLSDTDDATVKVFVKDKDSNSEPEFPEEVENGTISVAWGDEVRIVVEPKTGVGPRQVPWCGQGALSGISADALEERYDLTWYESVDSSTTEYGFKKTLCFTMPAGNVSLSGVSAAQGYAFRFESNSVNEETRFVFAAYPGSGPYALEVPSCTFTAPEDMCFVAWETDLFSAAAAMRWMPGDSVSLLSENGALIDLSQMDGALYVWARWGYGIAVDPDLDGGQISVIGVGTYERADGGLTAACPGDTVRVKVGDGALPNGLVLLVNDNRVDYNENLGCYPFEMPADDVLLTVMATV